MFGAQLRMLWYSSTNWLAGLNVNIPVNMKEYFRLNDFDFRVISLVCLKKLKLTNTSTVERCCYDIAVPVK
jgi:hypothetical protein